MVSSFLQESRLPTYRSPYESFVVDFLVLCLGQPLYLLLSLLFSILNSPGELLNLSLSVYVLLKDIATKYKNNIASYSIHHE